jgi:acyl-coenzyme A synthetase/AMP-(fatty) acid ligase
MGPFDQTPLCAGAAYLGRVAVSAAGRDWTWRDVHASSLPLARRLAGAQAVCNLCGSRLGFLVTWLAALRSGCLQVLPPSGGHADLAAILKDNAGPVIVVDDEALLQPAWRDYARCITHVPEVPVESVSDAALAWVCDFDATLLRLYTSGSTGTPQAQAKTLGQLMRGAQVLAERLDEEVQGGPALRQIVCSVAPQHMFGLETSVMLPLLTGLAVLDARPLLPADVRAALERNDRASAWIATPLHLRALVQAQERLPNCRVVVASTMPLAQPIAAQAETLVQASVLEIYGSTETGVVAMRRTAREAAWHPVQGVRVEPAESGTTVWGSHFESPRLLADLVEAGENGGFMLLGRRGDLIKIAGRRASLAGLNLLLQDLPGLEDGVFHLPATGSLTERLVLIYAGAPLDQRATAWLRERMDPIFLPRAMIRVERLPRADGGKLSVTALDALYAARGTKGEPR